LPSRRRKAPVTTSARASPRDDDARARRGEVSDEPLLLLAHLRARWYPKDDVLAGCAVLARALPVAALRCAIAPRCLELAQVTQVGIGDENHIAAPASVTPHRAPFGAALTQS